MGKRLSKIYTRTGDQGETGLGDGRRIAKDHVRIQAIGSIDELNSFIGLLIEGLRLESGSEAAELIKLVEFLQDCQHRIFDLGGELSIPGHIIISGEDISKIEHALDLLNKDLATLENFILPGGTQLIATFHLSRSICRRAERDLISLNRNENEAVNLEGIIFLNRLSDYLFVAARYAAKILNVDEVLWQKKNKD